LISLQGTGPGGRIVKKDVEAAAAPSAGGTVHAPAWGTAETAKGGVQIRELSTLQEAVARRMAESKDKALLEVPIGLAI
jgi:pyruvate dehydrogenase E2 component (dihydrolipoamide acetyltransferase)